jgi:predicted AAA+ superfamily ATPase
MANIEGLITRAEALLEKLGAYLPANEQEVNWNSLAWRWQERNGRGYLEAVPHPHQIKLESICNVDAQKSEVVRNTAQFVNGFPANNVLLTGARGTGKSTLVKALLSEFAKDGLRIIEVGKQDLVALPEIVNLIRSRPERFIVFCDDLSFEVAEPGYKALKVVLDGSISATSENVIVYATSNRRHLMPEFMAENLETQYVGEEIRPGETSEEKISLSERFGLWLSFYAFDQDEYLNVAAYWLKQYGIAEMHQEVRQAALLFSLTRGARSGRVAYQFARDYAGQKALDHKKKSS